MIEELPAFSDHLCHDLEEDGLHFPICMHRRDSRWARHVREHRPAEFEVSPESVTRLRCKCHAQSMKSLGAMRSCRVERTQQRKQSQSHLRLSTTNLEKRWWTGRLYSDTIRHPTDYIADI